MLERVGLGQVRFNVPGLSVDARGAVGGRQMVLRFSALDRMISFLRLWSGEQALDDVLAGLRLIQARTTAGTREALVYLPVTSAPLAEAVARAARAAGGQCFTGAGKHFVQFRDSRAPLGYDATSLEMPPPAVDFVLYGVEQTLAYAVHGEIPLDKLLLRLDLARQQGETEARRDVLFLTVRRGLGALVIEYLSRAQRACPTFRIGAALCESPDEGTFQRRPAFWIMKLEEMPPRLLGVLSGTPGLTLLAPVAENVAIAVGFRHPIHLGACRLALPAHRLYLFAPQPAGVTVIDPAPVFSPIADMVRLEGGARSVWAEAPLAAEARPAALPDFVVPLRLEAAPTGVARAVATLVPWARAGWLRALCYALPASALRGYRLAILERGLLVIAPDALHGFPFGQLLHAPAPGLLAPLGWEIRPPVSPVELAASVGATGGAVVVFPGPDEPPFRIAAESLATLQARALGDPRLRNLRVEHPSRSVAAREPSLDIEIDNQSLGPMPLWRLDR